MYPKRKNLSPAEMAAAVKKDIVDNQFLVTGQLTRDIYDESATFTALKLPVEAGTLLLFRSDRALVETAAVTQPRFTIRMHFHGHYA